MSRVLALAFLAALSSAAPAAAADQAADFVGKFSGEWLGTGQLLFGPQFGTKFHCELTGTPSKSQLTFGMKGRCWMGNISGPVNAQLRYNAETNSFYGEFMDGSEGNGVDVVGGGRVGEGFALRLSRGTTQGKLVAEAVNADQMTVMLSVRDKVNERDFPVVAMGFTRKDATALGLPKYMPDVTGSISGQK
jgi:hypothetical protein